MLQKLWSATVWIVTAGVVPGINLLLKVLGWFWPCIEKFRVMVDFVIEKVGRYAFAMIIALFPLVLYLVKSILEAMGDGIREIAELKADMVSEEAFSLFNTAYHWACCFEAIFPLQIFISILGVLLALRIACTLYRLVKSWVPTLS
jgi:hypothetical protein